MQSTGNVFTLTCWFTCFHTYNNPSWLCSGQSIFHLNTAAFFRSGLTQEQQGGSTKAQIEFLLMLKLEDCLQFCSKEAAGGLCSHVLQFLCVTMQPSAQVVHGYFLEHHKPSGLCVMQCFVHSLSAGHFVPFSLEDAVQWQCHGWTEGETGFAAVQLARQVWQRQWQGSSGLK